MSQHRELNNNSNDSNYTYKQHYEKSEQKQKNVNDRENYNNDSRTDYRVLRCFCGCTNLTFEQIEQFSMMSASGLVTHPLCKLLFRNFLKIGHRTDKSNALLSLECYEICDKLLNEKQFNSDIVDELIEMCPSFVWETKINNAIDYTTKTNDKQQITHLLNELKRDCVNTIECHNDFDRFRKELLRKIGK